MRIGKFLSNLGLPILAKNDLVENIDTTKQDISGLLPVLEDAGELLSGAPKSAAGKAWEKAYNHSRPPVYRSARKPWVQDARTFIQNNQTLLDRLLDNVEKEFGKDVVIEGIDYTRATVLQLIGLIGFSTSYTRRKLAHLLAAEANVEARTLPVGRERMEGELRWLEANELMYFRAMEVLSIPAAELTKALEKIPAMRFDPEQEAAQLAASGPSVVDPLQLNLVDIGAVNLYTWNPFYIWGLARTTYKLHKIDRMKSDIKGIQLRLEQLRLQAKGGADAALETRIAFYEEEAQRIGQKMAKLEKTK